MIRSLWGQRGCRATAERILSTPGHLGDQVSHYFLGPSLWLQWWQLLLPCLLHGPQSEVDLGSLRTLRDLAKNYYVFICPCLILSWTQLSMEYGPEDVYWLADTVLFSEQSLFPAQDHGLEVCSAEQIRASLHSGPAGSHLSLASEPPRISAYHSWKGPTKAIYAKSSLHR